MQKNKVDDAYDAMVLIEDTLKGKTKKSKVSTKVTKEVKKEEPSVDEDESYEELLKQFKEMRKANGKG